MMAIAMQNLELITNWTEAECLLECGAEVWYYSPPINILNSDFFLSC